MKIERVIEAVDVANTNATRLTSHTTEGPTVIGVFEFGQGSHTIIPFYDYRCHRCFPKGFQPDTVPPADYICNLVKYDFKPGQKLIETVIKINGLPNHVAYVLSTTNLGEVMEPVAFFEQMEKGGFSESGPGDGEPSTH